MTSYAPSRRTRPAASHDRIGAGERVTGCSYAIRFGFVHASVGEREGLARHGVSAATGAVARVEWGRRASVASPIRPPRNEIAAIAQDALS
jgi:hypothetical protein